MRPSRLAALAAGLLCLLLATSAAARESAVSPAELDAQQAALARASDAVLGVLATATAGATSIETLGAHRAGSGVVIGDDGLVLTIGYLILEAEQVELLLDSGKRLPARVVAYDQASGFGLVQALVPLALVPARLGRADAVGEGEPLLFVSGGVAGALSLAQLASRRPFSGYWEYHIEGALFTQPPRPDHSGAGLFNARGELVGVGSLLVPDAQGDGSRRAGNMFVPVDLLAPILTELRERGASRASARAWLGLNCQEDGDGLKVLRTSRNGPARAAGIEAGDVIMRIDGQPVSRLEAFYKALWGGGVEREVRLEVKRDGRLREVPVRSMDRMQALTRARGI